MVRMLTSMDGNDSDQVGDYGGYLPSGTLASGGHRCNLLTVGAMSDTTGYG